MPPQDFPIILCRASDEAKQAVIHYSEALKAAAPHIGNHGMSPEEFLDSGLFRSAIERLRGQQAASMTEERAFVAGVLD